MGWVECMERFWVFLSRLRCFSQRLTGMCCIFCDALSTFWAAFGRRGEKEQKELFVTTLFLQVAWKMENNY
jgi:hypothetical protein